MGVIILVFFPKMLESKPEASVETTSKRGELKEGKLFKGATVLASIIGFIIVTIPGWTAIEYPIWVTVAGWTITLVALGLALFYEILRINRHYKD